MVAPINYPFTPMAKKLEKYVLNINEILEQDTRNIVEARAISSKKRELVFALKNTIEKMMYMNYTIKNQVHIFEQNIPMFSMTVDTYRKHIYSIIDDSILRTHRINGVLTQKIKSISNAKNIFADRAKEFNYLELGKIEIRQDDFITVKDYTFFIDLFEENKETSVTQTVSYDKKDEVFVEIGHPKKSINKAEDVTTSAGIKHDKTSIVEDVKEDAIVVKEDKTTIPDLPNTTSLDTVETVSKKDINDEDFIIGVSQTDASCIIQRVGLEMDPAKIPGELRSTIKYTDDRNGINENFSYFKNIKVFQMSNYLPLDNELVLVDHYNMNNKSIIAAFRYDEKSGKLFYTREFRGHIGYDRLFDQWFRKHQSKELFRALTDVIKK